ncbi:MAG: MBL fold metallo-hydrolase [Ktedonobacteraceae bacterium]
MTGRQCFKLCFWGVRGSYPTPGSNTVRHGGNTSCIEVQAGAHTLIFDAGSGIIRLGNELLQRAEGNPLSLSLFITHGHGDHLVGFPFFAPLYEAQATIDCFGPQLADMSIEQVVTRVMSPPYFPVDIHNLPSQRMFHTISGREQVVWRENSSKPQLEARQTPVEATSVRVFAQMTESHPLDGAALYRIEYAGHSIVYATDVEWGEQCDPKFLAFAEGADVLIHDAQYTNGDYQQSKHGFGHSTIEMATDVARAAHVGQLILFHHEPTYDDQQLDSMETEAHTRFAHTRSAYEGLEIDLLASG